MPTAFAKVAKLPLGAKITGGALEMHEQFRYLVLAFRQQGKS